MRPIASRVANSSTCTEWSITSSAGISGLIRSGSPPWSRIASRIAARSTTHGHAGEVLEEDARRRERDLARRLVGRDPAGDGLDLGVGAVPEHVLEQDAQRVREPRDVPRRLERVEPVDRIGLVSDVKLLGLGHASIQAEAPQTAFFGSLQGKSDFTWTPWRSQS